MFYAMSSETLLTHANLRASMLRDRAHQFVTRHHWRLCVDAKGFELDEYDDDATTYCMVENNGRHAASLRLRAEEDGSMVEAHFPELWNESGEHLKNTAEVTRFCASPSLAGECRDAAISDLLLGLCRYCIREDIPSFFGVVFPSVARVLASLGWRPEIRSKAKHDGLTLFLCEWRASEFVAWDIQEALERRKAQSLIRTTRAKARVLESA